MSDTSIRRATADDAESIAAIHEAAVLGERGGEYSDAEIDAWARRRSAVELRGKMDSRRFFIAEGSNGPVAYAQLDLEASTVRSIYVLPAHQRRGVGRRLNRAVVELAIASGLQRLELDSSPNAVPFYEAIDFVRLGDVDHRFEDGVTMRCVRMARGLRGASGE